MVLSITSFAHNVSQSGILESEQMTVGSYSTTCYGGIDAGWYVRETAHLNDGYTSYSFASLSDYYKSLFRSGANMWSSAGITFEEDDVNYEGLIGTTYMDDTSIAFLVDPVVLGDVDSNGHITQWFVYLNSKNQSYFTAAVAAHEFGHVIGLVDLYDHPNIDKLMFYSDSGTATAPTSADIKGAKVITGLHSSHSWVYKIYELSTYGNRHYAVCSGCDGMKYNSLQYCSYDVSHKCIYCKVPKGATLNQLPDIPEMQ